MLCDKMIMCSYKIAQVVKNDRKVHKNMKKGLYNVVIMVYNKEKTK